MRVIVIDGTVGAATLALAMSRFTQAGGEIHLEVPTGGEARNTGTGPVKAAPPR